MARKTAIITGMAAFSLFGLAPYTKGKELAGTLDCIQNKNRLLTPVIQLQITRPTTGSDEDGMILLVRDHNYAIQSRQAIPTGATEVFLPMPPPGHYWLELQGGGSWRNLIFALQVGTSPLRGELVLEPVLGAEKLLQRFSNPEQRSIRSLGEL